MLSHAASSLSGKRPILQGPAVVGSRLRARPNCWEAESEVLAGPNDAGIYADFPPDMSGNPRPARTYLFDFIPGDATNKNCGMFLSKGR